MFLFQLLSTMQKYINFCVKVTKLRMFKILLLLAVVPFETIMLPGEKGILFSLGSLHIFYVIFLQYYTSYSIFDKV